MIPAWARDASGSAQTINARSETAATRPAFRDALASRRCLVPVKRVCPSGCGRARRNSRTVLKSMTGSYSRSRGCGTAGKTRMANWIKSCSILTTTPNAVTSTVHDRMPVILDRADYDLWVDPGMKNVNALSEMLKPYDARTMRCYPVSSRINRVANDDAECCLPVELVRAQARLF
jgi:putative SOS response-associated peptidase YedK